MKKFLLSFFAALATFALSAQQVHSVDVTAVVNADGSARITQVWDATVTSGTEWYIPMENLDRMSVSNLTVCEGDRIYTSEGTAWDIDRNMQQKAFRCGIVKKKNGVELCWGQGSLGRHVWEASFDVTGLVQSLQDADGFNFMFVNPGIAPISRASVTIENATGGEPWTSDNVKVWGFGFNGNIEVEDGKIICTSTESMSKQRKVIVLARFDKGLLQPAVSRDISFEKLQKKAFRGSDYKTEEEKMGVFALVVALIAIVPLLLLLVWLIIQKATGRTQSKKIYGVYKVDGWHHDVPQEGNLFASYYVLQKGERFFPKDRSKDLIGACMLKWVLEKKAVPVPVNGRKKRYDLHLKTDADIESAAERALFNMVVEAAGDNKILEANEMERWSKKHCERIIKWPKTAENEGGKYLEWMGRIDSRGNSTEIGKEKAQEVLQFKNYLKDFTLSDEREVPEVALWKDYLVFAQLYGIANEVTAQLKKLYPADFDQFAKQYDSDVSTLPTFINLNRIMAYNSILNATTAQAAAQSSGRIGGGGGWTSIGGGGGFSGGGFGGGSR
ncbi:MAG: DUF2207 domain-containing protein [Bacteroidales bacterium]|nr:DUF2207 domain-containing protein [Bacteroidales bacterium]